MAPNPVKDALHYGNQLKKINILDKELSTQKYEIYKIDFGPCQQCKIRNCLF